jgi:dTDP-4-dehydrorhamnose reductase
VLANNRPEVVVNCIGVVKQDAAAKDPLTSIEVNALFPHRLAKACAEIGSRLIHLSTDCVFSGQRGNYSVSDPADATDLYGRTKLLGEVDYDHCLTLRTSMIGRELVGSHGLVEWFLSQQGKVVRGYQKAVFSGFTTGTLAAAIADVISDHHELKGIWHFASEPINKFALLGLIKEGFGLKIEIEPDETFVCDRSLNGDAFRQATGYVAPSWSEMVEAMVRDTTPYEEIRRRSC